ncbi:hypothetical protein ANCCAN_24881 [Ancylostoma caninum]|uniref:C-type lectin domain-containing protein n=1 Tax=Ancylostoma caninum TaxID=29170 RepID=A0A368FAZ8_ANCCA|nr:hypothetical protein ANCCAN_24881 [Ancylostoma caninum]
MVADHPLACTVEDGGKAWKLVTCPKGQVSYYRKNGHLVCHKVINKPTTWPDAEKECEEIENGYKLASFEDGQEAESVMELFVFREIYPQNVDSIGNDSRDMY